MSKESCISLVLGCGKRGAEWVKKQRTDNVYIGLDHAIPETYCPNFVQAEAFSLPFKKGSIDRIYVDFVLNAAEVKDYPIMDIINKPLLLSEKFFPREINHWFNYELNGSEEKVGGNLEKIRWLLRGCFLREMWHALSQNGEIIVVDKPHIVKWINNNALEILRVNAGDVRINFPLPLSTTDLSRSESLFKVIYELREAAQKISIEKLR